MLANATARLLEQRSRGHVHLRMDEHGVSILKEAGAAKVRLPFGGNEAILINTSGGLAGGDTVDVRVEAGARSELVVTTQAAERVYRTLGPPAEINISLKAENGSRLYWLPQETIVFDNSAVRRSINVDLAGDAVFLAVEAVVFGRREMNESVLSLLFIDHWRIHREGRLIHAEHMQLGSELPRSAATLASNTAIATLLFIGSGAEEKLGAARALLNEGSAASAWNGKLVARLLAKDGFELRKILVRLISAIVHPYALPKLWTS
jgi:urease accessory protein